MVRLPQAHLICYCFAEKPSLTAEASPCTQGRDFSTPAGVVYGVALDKRLSWFCVSSDACEVLVEAGGGGLSALDTVEVMYEGVCAEEVASRTGIQVMATTEDTDYFISSFDLAQVESGTHSICYCQNSAFGDCSNWGRFGQFAGELRVAGVRFVEGLCFLSTPCRLPVRGWHLDRMDMVQVAASQTCGQGSGSADQGQKRMQMRAREPSI